VGSVGAIPIWVSYPAYRKRHCFQGFHGLGFPDRDFVIMANQVHQAMNDQVGGMMVERETAFGGLTRARFVRQGNVAEQDRWPFGLKLEQFGTLQHRER
jgi:hypothetical protein